MENEEGEAPLVEKGVAAGAKTKEDIRKAMRDRRHEIGTTARLEAGKKIAKSLGSDEVQMLLRAWKVCVYLSGPHEIPTRFIVRDVWAADRETCAPGWSNSMRRYQLYALTPQTRVITGKYGIREPGDHSAIVMPWEVDVFILPGLAFDTTGGRLGYGGGHYDTILKDANPRAIKIGICFDWQILDEPLPQEPHDIRADWVISEKRIIHCAKPAVEAAKN